MKARKPTVSVLCLTYNQKDYIRQALDSFLMQKTEFDFEVLINDDASTDGTAEILKEYAAKHPGIIKPIFQKENQYSQGKRNFIARFLLPEAQGKYLALCEGDDYWTDPDKLQLQVDFLEKHPECSICFHPVRVFFENGEQPDSLFPKSGSKKFTVTELLKDNFIQTNSVMYRAQNYEGIAKNVTPGDWYLHLYHAQFGKIGFIDRVMANYRRHPGGIWWNAYKEPSLIWIKHGVDYLAFLHTIMSMYGSVARYRKIILQKHIAGSFEAMALLSPADIDEVAVNAIRAASVETWSYIKHLIDQVAHYSKHDAYLQGVLESETLYHEQIDKQKEQTIKQLSDELHAIKSSKAWKAVRVVRFGKHPIDSVQHIHTRKKD